MITGVCRTPGCGRRYGATKKGKKEGGRGLCSVCYAAASRLVRAEKTTWDELLALGLTEKAPAPAPAQTDQVRTGIPRRESPAPRGRPAAGGTVGPGVRRPPGRTVRPRNPGGNPVNDPNKNAPNTPWVERRIAKLKIIRAAGDAGVPVGWGDTEVCPPDANTLAKAGLVEIVPTAAGRVVKAKK